MSLRRSRFRFWVTVYAFPAIFPLFFMVLWQWFVHPPIVDALGHGAAGKITIGVLAVSVGMGLAVLLMANLMAYGHAKNGLPAIPADPMPESMPPRDDAAIADPSIAYGSGVVEQTQ